MARTEIEIKVIKLKLKTEYFNAVLNGTKKSELRIDDNNDFQVDDYLYFIEVDQNGNYFNNNRRALYKITYITNCSEIDSKCDKRLKMICFE